MELLVLTNDDELYRRVGASGVIGDFAMIPVPPGVDPWQVFCAVSGALEACRSFRDGGVRTYRETLVLVDHRALETGRGGVDPVQWPSAFAMVALAYPELYWVTLVAPFRVLAGPTAERDRVRDQLHSVVMGDWNRLSELARLRRAGLSTLFDGAGYRENLKIPYFNGMEGKPVPRRRKTSVAIDDEPSFALLHAYAAYRNGYRGFAVTSRTIMEALLGKGGVLAQHDDFGLALEDLYLNFRDDPPSDSGVKVHFSDRITRDALFPVLASDGLKRVLITTAHSRAGEGGSEWEDRGYVRLFKPVGGVQQIARLGRFEAFRAASSEDYAWPPDSGRGEGVSGHSSSGRVMLVVEKLMTRARAFAVDCRSVEDAITGATLALEAQQLLMDMTPTTSLEALQLRHELEVMAEASFVGVGFHAEVAPRVREAELEIETIVVGDTRARELYWELNAKASLVNAIARRYREYNQIDEELACIREARRYHRQLTTAAKNPRLEKLRWYQWPTRTLRWALAWVDRMARWYFDLLVSHSWAMGVAGVGWPILFGVIFYAMEIDVPRSENGNVLPVAPNLASSILFSFTNFLAVGPIDGGWMILQGGPVGWLVTAEMACGVLHLGLFVSHLYAMLARR